MSIVDGVLIIEDVEGGNSDDSLTVSIDRSNVAEKIIRISDSKLSVGLTGTIAGATSSLDGLSVTIPVGLVRKGIQVLTRVSLCADPYLPVALVRGERY